MEVNFYEKLISMGKTIGLDWVVTILLFVVVPVAFAIALLWPF